jgi:hypothetical protein
VDAPKAAPRSSGSMRSRAPRAHACNGSCASASSAPTACRPGPSSPSGPTSTIRPAGSARDARHRTPQPQNASKGRNLDCARVMTASRQGRQPSVPHTARAECECPCKCNEWKRWEAPDTASNSNDLISQECEAGCGRAGRNQHRRSVVWHGRVWKG